MGGFEARKMWYVATTTPMSKEKVASYPVEKRNECFCNVDISPFRSCFEFDGKPVIAEEGHVAEMTQAL